MAKHNKRIYESILELRSNVDNPTPLVRLKKSVPHQKAKIYAKLEWYNPFGSVKDRVASNLIEEAIVAKQLKENDILVEPTSGNTGLALTMLGNIYGHTVSSPLSNRIPLTKRALLRFEGNKLIELDDELCPAPGATEGAIAMAESMALAENYVMLNQYKNPNNPNAHYKTTGPEIWSQTSGRITHFVAGLGTCGTINGNSRFLRQKNPSIQVIGVYPEPGHDIPGVRSKTQLKQSKLYDPSLYSEEIQVTNKRSFELLVVINQQDGIIAGPSSAMALAGAIESIPDEDGVIAVVIFPDSIFKYTESVQKHLPKLFEGQSAPANAGNGGMSDVVEMARIEENQVELTEAQNLYDTKSAVFVDVRNDEQYNEKHIPGVTHVSLEDIRMYLDDQLPDTKDTSIVTVCNRGNQSLEGLILLKAKGYTNVRSFKEGTNGWEQSGLPIESGKSVA